MTREITRTVSNRVAGKLAGDLGKSIGGSMGGVPLVALRLQDHRWSGTATCGPSLRPARPNSTGVRTRKRLPSTTFTQAQQAASSTVWIAPRFDRTGSVTLPSDEFLVMSRVYHNQDFGFSIHVRLVADYGEFEAAVKGAVAMHRYSVIKIIRYAVRTV